MDEIKASLTRQWLRKAANDLKTASIVSSAPDGPLDTAIYHCQQAAEKAVKAFLTWQDEPFEKTHDIVRLIRLAEPAEPRFGKLLEQARLLTPLAWRFRYPDEAPGNEPTREEFEKAVAQAKSIVSFVLELLPREVHS